MMLAICKSRYTMYDVSNRSPSSSKKPLAQRNPIVCIRATPKHIRAIRTFIHLQRVRTSRTAVILAALEEFLGKEGLWPPK